MHAQKKKFLAAHIIRTYTALLLAALALTGASTAAAAGKILVQLEGIEGPSVEKGFEGAIEAEAWSWGMSQPSATVGSTGSYTTGAKVNVESLSFSQKIDLTSPVLMHHCASGTQIPRARVVLRAANRDGLFTYMVIELEKVMVASIAVSSNADGYPTQEVSLSFGKYKVIYQPYSLDGKPKGGQIESGWDLEKNVRL